VLNVAFIGVTFWLIPETKGVTLEHIERKLMAEKLRISACDG
jgi:SP family arabinose:H+ symporter-like MFS transporter